jgi:hypothetical protein
MCLILSKTITIFFEEKTKMSKPYVSMSEPIKAMRKQVK